jgi:DNA invertase Pin-like site-specific DNA recombinase
MSPHQAKFIAYFRVSTDKQGKSGLGLEAQRKAVLDYLNGGRWERCRNSSRLRAASTTSARRSRRRRAAPG